MPCLPRRDWPYLATQPDPHLPFHTSPRLALPWRPIRTCLARPCPAKRRLNKPTRPNLACLTGTCLTVHSVPELARPCHACRTRPDLAMTYGPDRAGPIRTIPRLRSHTVLDHGRRDPASPSYPHTASTVETDPTRTRRTRPEPALPRLPCRTRTRPISSHLDRHPKPYCPTRSLQATPVPALPSRSRLPRHAGPDVAPSPAAIPALPAHQTVSHLSASYPALHVEPGGPDQNSHRRPCPTLPASPRPTSTSLNIHAVALAHREAPRLICRARPCHG